MIMKRSPPGAAWIFGGFLALTCRVIAPGGEDRAAAASPGSAAPRVVAAWPAGPMEVRAAFDGPIDPSVARAMVGRSIPFGEPANRGAGPRLAVTLGRLRIAAARLDDGGRTLVLATDPHPRPASYVLTVPLDDASGRSAPRGESRWPTTWAASRSSGSAAGRDRSLRGRDGGPRLTLHRLAPSPTARSSTSEPSRGWPGPAV